MKNLYPILQKIKRLFLIIFYKCCLIFTKCDRKRVLIASNTKTELYGNLLYIYEELKKHQEYKMKILLINKANFFQKIKFEFIFAYWMAKSKFILIDDFFPTVYPLKVRKNSKLIQVWHAVGAFKKVGYSRNNINKEKSITHKNYTDTIVSSDNIVDNYAEAFGIKKECVHPLGVPRTDIFFDKKLLMTKKEEILKRHEILKDKNIILFAPTFRGSGRNSAYYPEKYINLKMIYESLKSEDIFIIKYHPFVKNKLNIPKEYEDKIIDYTGYKDINDLLIITNLLITDYSSVIFDYALLSRPIVFYIPDYEEYKNSRDFYYKFDKYIYGPKTFSQKELIEYLHSTKVDKEKLRNFKLKFMEKCDGNSTQRFVNEIILQNEGMINEENNKKNNY